MRGRVISKSRADRDAKEEGWRYNTGGPCASAVAAQDTAVLALAAAMTRRRDHMAGGSFERGFGRNELELPRDDDTESMVFGTESCRILKIVHA